jgi:hypothetical protein
VTASPAAAAEDDTMQAGPNSNADSASPAAHLWLLQTARRAASDPSSLQRGAKASN